MSHDLSHGRGITPDPVLLPDDHLPPIPDSVLSSPASAHLRPETWFANPDAPLEIEVGCGKGAFLIQQATIRPEVNFLAFEYAREYAAYAADRARRRNLRNVVVLAADAAEFLHWRLPNSTADVIHLYFPDPWPKARHHRRRMIQDRFLADAWRLLKPAGELRVVTDHAEYWEWMQRFFARWTGAETDVLARTVAALPPAFASLWPTPDRAPAAPFTLLPFEPPESAGQDELVGSNFERKYRVEGRSFHSAALRRTPARNETHSR